MLYSNIVKFEIFGQNLLSSLKLVLKSVNHSDSVFLQTVIIFK